MPFTHPEKHKPRWSVYSLSEALRLVGLRPLPLRYYDRDGARHDDAPASIRARYPAVLVEEEVVLTLAYLQRPPSLIVDGIKEPSVPEDSRIGRVNERVQHGTAPDDVGASSP